MNIDDVLRSLLERHQDVVPLDAIGDAIGARAISTEQIEQLLDAIERSGRTIAAPTEARGVETLRKVIPTARALGNELGRTATVTEIAARANLAEDEVRRALLLAKVMQRR
jgi:hypothetical protein